MTLRELLDAATPGPWTPGVKWRTIQGATTQAVNDPDGNEVGHSWFTPEDARLIALAPELAALVLDMADALGQRQHEGGTWEGDDGKGHRIRCLDCGGVWWEDDDGAVEDGDMRCFTPEVVALLARLDRISTQTCEGES